MNVQSINPTIVKLMLAETLLKTVLADETLSAETKNAKSNELMQTMKALLIKEYGPEKALSIAERALAATHAKRVQAA